MNDQNDDGQTWALMVLAGVVAMVIAGVIGLAAHASMQRAARAAGVASMSPADDADGSVYFQVGSAALPAASSETIVKVSDAARAQAGATVVISGYRDASGDAANNAELAEKRALAVRHALEANGVAPERLLLDKPLEPSPGQDARTSRRVDMRIR